MTAKQNKYNFNKAFNDRAFFPFFSFTTTFLTTQTTRPGPFRRKRMATEALYTFFYHRRLRTGRSHRVGPEITQIRKQRRLFLRIEGQRRMGGFPGRFVRGVSRSRVFAPFMRFTRKMRFSLGRCSLVGVQRMSGRFLEILDTCFSDISRVSGKIKWSFNIA